MELKDRSKTAAHIVIGLVSLLLMVSGLQMPGIGAKLLGSMPLVILLLFAAFDHFVWKWRWVLPFVKRPYIEGTWKGQLTSYRRDPETDKKITSVHDVVVVIDQTFTDVRITLMTKESKSRSIVSELISQGENDWVLFYQYDNTPKLQYRDKSAIHRGGSSIDIPGRLPETLYNEYWTNRESKGTFDLTLVSRAKVSTFESLSSVEEGTSNG